MLRPRPARWFEILAARDDATRLLEALAATGAVELEARPSATLPASFAEVRPLLRQFGELALRYHAYWPADDCAPSQFPEAPAATLQRCLGSLRAWARDAEPIVQALQRLDAERRELRLWQRVIAALDPGTLDYATLAGAGPLVQTRLFVFPPDAQPELPADLLARTLALEGGVHVLAAATPQQLAPVAQQAAALKGSVHEPPVWLRPDAARTEAFVREREPAIAAEERGLHAELEHAHRTHDLRRALGDASRLQWLLQNVRALEAGDLFCWVTGWSSDPGGARLAAAIEGCQARALLHFPPAPPEMKAPLLLDNPWWARPSELFSRALGMPSSSEADPSPLLAIAVPLMFGYMFGDVGQGLVLAAVGGWLRRRYAVARLLMVGGLAAAVFGLLFGSVFSVHGVVPALWLHPLDAPLTVLVVPVVGGAVLLTAGLLLSALEAHWRGALGAWLMTDAGALLAYLGLLASLLDARFLGAAAAGAAWFCGGHALHAHRAGAALTAMAELVERTLQILINTLSFARVGAFALAHAGLSSAIVALFTASPNPVVSALVLLLGNALVLVLEVMVVSIQTTRLVLFEFFTRFLVAEGRAFRPLPPPPFVSQTSRET